MLALHVLASGSKGNAALVEDVTTGHGVLIDCGICKRDFMARSGEAGFDPACIDAILITHDHADHTGKLGVVTRGLKRGDLELFALRPVLEASSHIRALENTVAQVPFVQGDLLTFGNISVQPFSTSHDAADSCGFRFETPDGDALGYVTDTGYLTPEARAGLRNVRILALESNHDRRMLAEGEYPYYLKERVASDQGHLSNDQAAGALEELAHDRLEHVVAMHLSENNNLPLYARRSLEGALAKVGCHAQVHVAAQHMLVSVF